MSAASNAAEISGKLRNFMSLGGEGYKALSGALDKACIGVEGAAKRRVPAKTGNLRNSITHVVRMGELTGYIGSSVPYAPYVEIGTGIYSSRGDGRKTPWLYPAVVKEPGGGHSVRLIPTHGSRPHPYLKPAVENNISAILKCFEGIF